MTALDTARATYAEAAAAFLDLASRVPLERYAGTDQRVVLLWDIWHPDLTAVEIEALALLFPVFDRMMRQAA